MSSELTYIQSVPKHMDNPKRDTLMDGLRAEVVEEFRKALLVKGNGNFMNGWRKHFDDGGDSKISFSGFYRGLASMGYTKDPSVLWQALGQEDEEGKVTISLNEIDPRSADTFKVFKEWVLSRGGPAKVFDAIDVDENHALQRDEFSRQVANLGLDLPQVSDGSSVVVDPINDLFGCLDQDGAGVISPDEFLFLESDPVKRRAVQRHLEQRRFEKLAGYDAGKKHRPWRAPNLIKQLNQRTNPIFGGKHFSQLTDGDMTLPDSVTHLLHRSSVTSSDSIFSRPFKNLTSPDMKVSKSSISFGNVDSDKPVWMLRALLELERADLTSSEGHRCDARQKIRDNLSEIQATEAILKELADSSKVDAPSVAPMNQPTWVGPRKNRVQAAQRKALQPWIAPLDVNCRKPSSSTRSSTRCNTADDMRPCSISSEDQARKRRAAYTAPPTPEIDRNYIEMRRRKRTLAGDSHRTTGRPGWAHVYRPATSPGDPIQPALHCTSTSAPQIGLKVARPASQPEMMKGLP